MKNYPYISAENRQHFPDCTVGEELYYSLDLSCWLATENDTITAVSWSVPNEHVTILDSSLGSNSAFVKLKVNRVGSHRVICTFDTDEGGNTQSKKIPVYLRAY